MKKKSEETTRARMLAIDTVFSGIKDLVKKDPEMNTVLVEFKLREFEYKKEGRININCY